MALIEYSKYVNIILHLLQPFCKLDGFICGRPSVI